MKISVNHRNYGGCKNLLSKTVVICEFKEDWVEGYLTPEKLAEYIKGAIRSSLETIEYCSSG